MNVITDNDALSTFCVRAARQPFVAVDTEFLREKTFWPQLCLIQLATPEDDAIVDPLAGGIDLEPLLQLMADEAVVKVFHAARQDVEIFYKLAGATPLPLFDSQVAAMVCGFGESVGYDTLVSTLTGVTIDKSQRFADWSARPLRDRQLAYARSDVTHLRDVYPLLLDRLAEGGRGEWVAEEMSALADPALYASPPAEAWRRLKVRSDDRRFLARVRALAAWREETAQTKDVPRNRVVRDETLLDVAANAPGDANAMRRARGVTKGLADGRYGQEMLAVLANVAQTADADLPPVEKKPIVNGAGPIGDLLKVLLKQRADASGVAQRLIATNQDLDLIAEDDDADTPALRGWRRDLFGEDALRLKRGELALTAWGKEVQMIAVAADGGQELLAPAKRRSSGGRRRRRPKTAEAPPKAEALQGPPS